MLRKAPNRKGNEQMYNSSARKYIPVYQRMAVTTCYRPYPQPSEEVTAPKHTRGEVDLYQAIPTTKPKLCYTMLRLWRRRVGQLELLPILTGKPSRKGTKRVY